MKTKYNIENICIDDYEFKFCKGCRTCHTTAKCIHNDDVLKVIEKYSWGDIPGQFKAFIDRCTPWCNTHEPHATISRGKKGYCIALRTGPSMKECNRIIESIEHFYGHLEIASMDSLGLCSIEYKDNVEYRRSEIAEFCNKIMNN